MDQQHKLSVSARAILEAVATHNDHLALVPDRLPVAAKRLVVQSLLKAGLIEETEADDEQTAWRTAEDGTRCVLRATEAGLQATGVAGPSIDELADHIEQAFTITINAPPTGWMG